MPRSRRILNLRLLALLMAGVAIVGATAVGVHALQTRRNADVLLQQAERAKEQGKVAEAIDYYQRYIALAPADRPMPWIELGTLQAESGRFGPAWQNLEAGLRKNPDDAATRRRLAEIYLTIGRFTNARTHLNYLKEQLLKDGSPDDGRLDYLSARCDLETSEFAKAEALLRAAIEKGPDNLEAYQLRSLLLQTRLKQPEEARTVLDQMVENNPQAFRAYVIRGSYRLNFASNDNAQASGDAGPRTQEDPKAAAVAAGANSAAALEDARKALELAPDEDLVIQFAVRCLLLNDKVDEARAQAERGLELFPKSAWPYAQLANIELRLQSDGKAQEHREKAVAWLNQGLRVVPKQQQQDLLWNAARLLIEEPGPGRESDAEQAKAGAARLAEAESLVARLRSLDYPRPPLMFLENRLLVQKKEWLKASENLEKLRPTLLAWPELMKETDFWLGRCYEELGKADLQLTAYRRAVSVDPDWVPARIGIANALQSAGRIDEALDEYRRVSTTSETPLSVLVHSARLMLLSNLRRNATEQNWTPVNTLLDEIERLSPREPQVALLRAEILVAQRQERAAEELLTAARDRSPQTLEYWLGLAALAERREDWAAAADLLQGAQNRVGDTVALRLARVRQMLRQKGLEARPAIRAAAESAADLKPEDRVILFNGLSDLAFYVQDFDEAQRLCALVADSPGEENDLRVRLRMFEAAVAAKRIAANDKTPGGDRANQMQRALDDLHRIEGDGPLWHYAEAVRLTLEAHEAQNLARQSDDQPGQQKSSEPDARFQEQQARVRKMYAQARDHLTQAQVKRPAWSRIPLLLAQISDSSGDSQAAVAEYLRAIEMGERRPEIIGRAAELLFLQKRDLEAGMILRRQQELQTPFSHDMAKLAADIALRLDDREWAIDMTKLASDRSTSSSRHLWAGAVQRVLASRATTNERRQELTNAAEKSFRRAIELEEASPGPWIALIQHLGATLRDPLMNRDAQTAKLEQALAEAERAIAPDQAPLALAECLDSIGREADAEARYKAALQAAKSKGPVLRKFAEFCLRHGRTTEAETYLTQLTGKSTGAADGDVLWARRGLASLLSASGGQANLEKALELIDQNIRQSPSSLPDRLAKAKVLAMFYDRKKREEAIALLEQIINDRRSATSDETAEERLVLAQLYNGLGESAKAMGQMRSLMASHGDKPRYIQRFVRFLLARKDVAEAELWVRQLENLAPRDVATLALTSEVLFLRERYEDLLRGAERYADDTRIDQAERQVRLRRTAALLEDFAGRLDPSLEPSGEAVDLKSKWKARFLEVAEAQLAAYVRQRPQESLALAAFYARQNRVPAAIDILERDWRSARPEEITAVTGALISAPGGSSEAFSRVEKVLRAALDEHQRPVILVLGLADVYSWRERYSEADALYREVLQKNERNAVALNNLALLLALQGDAGKESLRMVNKALDIAADDPALLDSRATIYLAVGDSQRATDDLSLSIELRPSPHSYFHQAQASFRLGKPDDAKASLSKALALGLSEVSLHPLERPGFRQLTRQLQ